MSHIVVKTEYDESTGIPFITDTRGNWHIIPWEMTSGDYINRPRLYLQTNLISNYVWPNTTEFHSIEDSLNPGTYLEYTVPSKKMLHLAFVVAAQSHYAQGWWRTQKYGVSVLGLYIDGQYTVGIPLVESLYYKLYEPIHIPANTHIEAKFNPFHTNLNLSLVLGSFILDKEF